MVTKLEALQKYNEMNNTQYVSVLELGQVLLKHALRTAWIESKKREAAIIADSEEMS